MAKPKDFSYYFEDVPSINPDHNIRVRVTKFGINDSSAPHSTPLSEYFVYGTEKEGLMCDCPSSRYRAMNGRCKHVEWTEEWRELRMRNFEQSDFYFSTADECFLDRND